MLTKKEILQLIAKTNILMEARANVDMILRNYAEDDKVSAEKLEVICQLIIKN